MFFGYISLKIEDFLILFNSNCSYSLALQCLLIKSSYICVEVYL
jgi:hypothetical protein